MNNVWGQFLEALNGYIGFHLTVAGLDLAIRL
jgi:hypothetical protein